MYPPGLTSDKAGEVGLLESEDSFFFFLLARIETRTTTSKGFPFLFRGELRGEKW